MNDDAPDDPVESATPEEKFYRGSITRLSSARQTGVVRSASSGRDIPFVFQFVDMVGPKQRFEELHIGTSVGYDVSWTSRGLRVSVIKILD